MDNMAELNFTSGAELDLEPGVKSYPISGGRGSICFNPTDTMFVEAVYSMLVRFADQMEQDKILGPYERAKPRGVLLTRAHWQERQLGQGE